MDEQELKSLLTQWAAIEPQRCRRRDDDRFDVQYSGQWTPITAQPESHGAIIAAALEGCHQNRIYCNIEYTPRYEEEPLMVAVGCIHRAFRWDDGEDAIYSIPSLLLAEYLEQLQAGETDN